MPYQLPLISASTWNKYLPETNLFKNSSFRYRRENQRTRVKPAEASMDGKPNAHMALAMGIKPWAQQCIALGKKRYATCFPCVMSLTWQNNNNNTITHL